MKIKKKFWLPTLLALTAAFTVACSSGASTSATKSTTGKDQFVYAIQSDPTDINPITTTNREGLTYVNMIFSPLVRIEADGSKKNELAKSMETSADGKTVTVKLRDDVKWSDGEKFTADDVVFTYKQRADKKNGRQNKMLVGDKLIEVKKIDDYTVEFILPSASAAAIENVATETYIIPEHVYKDVTDFSVKDLNIQPVGTGPYKLVENKRGEYIKFTANENYYGGQASIKDVVFRIIPNTDTAKVALQKGEIDATVVLPNDVADLDKETIASHEYTEGSVEYLGLNTKSEALKDPKVRQAIMYALNKEDLNKAVYLDNKFYETPNSFLPTDNPYKTDDVEKYATNVEKAKELLKEAGVSNLKLNLWYRGNDKAYTLQATLIQQQLQAVGITVELKGVESSALTAELLKKESTAYDMFLNMYIWGIDPDLYSVMYTSDSSRNYFRFNSTETDDLFKNAAVELDSAKRKEQYNELQKKIAKDAIVYPIVTKKRILAVNKNVENVDKAQLIPIYTFEDVSKLSKK
ncbi:MULTISPECIES: ABC transporter substrate-binding protein [unclassified Gemella]|uniref:ABC transporter substrate-binding protein n=1 Tax=unclassified Gemella TaxID=2624949 RepID=UPI0010736EDE|nr:MULTISPECIES: ABC transporter substrate-binding protein [unclassified Gemella]MBF0710646.1 ABC transporter substrate-binding protein [Gemella sp. GL1.1]MBF0746375.1 ABC transporter substrate-binding protein [Gemella sp. 19428wG2_WT2a]NYS27990.1 ABC transporter substrate-binding protein [Gemella sp. GL1]TFU60158.1 ABC transporter substrate-binding protein [Gemella sp. WT2a]